MKILILGVFGKHNEPEDPQFIHIYLASLKKHVVPKYDTKVVLLNTFKTVSSKESLSQKLVDEYGLTDIVELKNIYEMELPDISVQFFENMPWSSIVGFRMNLLFDYAKKNNFFDAEWLFHTDTDLEFLDNFSEYLSIYSKIPGNILISPTGDATDYCYKVDNIAFVLDEPDRINFYDESAVPPREQFDRAGLRKITRFELNPDEHLKDKFVFCFAQNKIRNDLVGMNRGTMTSPNLFNWVNCGYPFEFEIPDRMNPTSAEKELYEKWKLYGGVDGKIRFGMGWDKGSTIQLKLRKGTYGVTHISMQSGGSMTRHMGGGWLSENHHKQFLKAQYDELQQSYGEYSCVWKKDALKFNETIGE